MHARRTAAVATIATNRFLSRGHLLLLLHADATHAAAAAAAAAVGPCTPERHMGGASPRAPTLAALPALRTAPSPLACVAEQQSVDGRNTPRLCDDFPIMVKLSKCFYNDSTDS